VDTSAKALDHMRRVHLIAPRMAARLRRVDVLALKAGLLGANPDGLFKLDGQ
jgi:HD superfamily phosphodiesterase